MNTVFRPLHAASIIALSLFATGTGENLWAASPAEAVAPAEAVSPAQSASLTTSHREFCTIAQRRLVDTALPISNQVQPSRDSFTESKASANPLVTKQFSERDAQGRLVGISCKTKSADHLRAEHGATAARDPALPPRSCRDLHREMVVQLWAAEEAKSRSSAKFAPHEVLLDADSASYTGSGWIGSPAEAYLGSDGKLHLRASALFAEWEDWRWKIMPKSFRGNHYCHLVAPERIRALMLGQEQISR